MSASEPTLFKPVASLDERVLTAAYETAGRTLDDLPYTEEFERVFRAAEGDESGGNAARAELFHRLHNLRKAGRLPRLGRAVGKPPRIEREHERLLAELVEREAGRLSLRDNLPYTPAFDRIVGAFNAGTGLSLSPHSLWRIVAKLAK